MTWAKLPTALRVSLLLGLTFSAVAVGVVIGMRPEIRPLLEARLDAIPYQFGLILSVVVAIAVVAFSLKRTARRDRCLMALQALLFFCLFLNGVETVTPMQLAMAACLIGVLAFLALGRFEPKTPENRP